MSESAVPYENGESRVPHESQHAYLRLHSVDVFVKDQEQSLRFYLDQLGFELAFDARLQSGQRWVAVSPPNGTAVLTLIQPEPDSAEYKLIGRATRIAFVTEDVPGKFREWSKRGVRFRHTPRLRRIKYQKQIPETHGGDQSAGDRGQAPIWGEVFTRFEDIDRNSFVLLSLDEVSKAIEAQRRANAEKLQAERRIAHELDIAREVQARLFPQKFPACSTLEYAGVCVQARQVGGDYYDFLSLAEKRLGLVIGDVAGKGMAAALLMANLQANLRSQCAMALDDPEKLLRSVNQLFYENTAPSVYATLFFGDYDDELRRLRYVNCGHLSGLLLRRDNSVERLESTCTVLGLFTDWDCAIGECRLLQGDILALYTDGVTESFNEAGIVTCLLERWCKRFWRTFSTSVLRNSAMTSRSSWQSAEAFSFITLLCRSGTQFVWFSAHAEGPLIRRERLCSSRNKLLVRLPFGEGMWMIERIPRPSAKGRI